MNIENTLPTRGQLERQLSQTLQSTYRQQFGNPIGKVTCNLLNNKVAIVAEDRVTEVEKVLLNNDRVDLANELRSAINKIFRTQIKQTVADIMQVEVVDIVYDSILSSGYLGALVLLNNTPHIRSNNKAYFRRPAPDAVDLKSSLRLVSDGNSKVDME
ncbi:DUF2294 domain-containing protein [Pleurocapsales cyanobacterium LEGE 10410]|nr:DUF2294 domain-containing protein [Pleurocapsales cyanobacterium LEGE 10410]